MLPLLINTLLSGIEAAGPINQVDQPGVYWSPSRYIPGGTPESFYPQPYPFAIHSMYPAPRHNKVLEALQNAKPEVLHQILADLNAGGNLEVDRNLQQLGSHGQAGGEAKEKRMARYGGGLSKWSLRSPNGIFNKMLHLNKKGFDSGRTRDGIYRSFNNYKNNLRYLRFSKRADKEADETKPIHEKQGQAEFVDSAR